MKLSILKVRSYCWILAKNIEIQKNIKNGTYNFRNKSCTVALKRFILVSFFALLYRLKGYIYIKDRTTLIVSKIICLLSKWCLLPYDYHCLVEHSNIFFFLFSTFISLSTFSRNMADNIKFE